jgi:hypothetical protein
MKKGVMHGCVAHLKGSRNEYILVWKPQAKKVLGKSKNDNFKIKLKEIIWKMWTGYN